MTIKKVCRETSKEVQSKVADLVTAAFIGVFSVIAAITAGQVLSLYEGRVWPVVDLFVVDEMREGDGSLYLSGSFTKLRACEFLYVMAWIERRDTGEVERLPLRFFDDGAQNAESPAESRPIGTSRYGEWKVDAPRILGSGRVRLQSVHACHGSGFWSTRTPLGSFDYPYQATQDTLPAQLNSPAPPVE